MRARRGFRMILHGEYRTIQAGHALDGPVIEAGMGQLHATERCIYDRHFLLRLTDRKAHPEVMILGCDLDFSGPKVHDRMIGAMVAEL